MGRKADIKQPQFLAWDQFDGKEPKEALPAIYNHAAEFSARCRAWYWHSIQHKRTVSTGARFTAFALAAFGVVAPLTAAMWSLDGQRLLWSQLAVAAFALAGLVQLADRVFGWSSGWLRYISTVMAMENLTRQFELDWAGYFIALGRAVRPAEVRAVFDIAERFEIQVAELEKRVTEFNTGLAALNDIMKTARESTQKTEAEARDALHALSKTRSPGAIELTATTTSQLLPTMAVALDDGQAEVCNGLTWAKLKVDPGPHRMVIQASHDNTLLSEIVKIVEVPPGSTMRLTVAM
ncbi:MAG: SLATT domain-containing protein [Deltaproteobacteria bacterium]|nr:MAG: SLATT domain-containing protein [Deltaproteobacteria bacterium]